MITLGLILFCVGWFALMIQCFEVAIALFGIMVILLAHA